MSPHQLADDVLIEACQQGDRAMQFALYQRFANKMMGVCRRYTKSKMEAEDQLQESFVLVFKHLPGFRGGSLEGWIRRIVVNQCIGYFRKMKTKDVWCDSSIEQHENFTLDDSWVSETDSDLIMNWIDGLPLGAKTVFNMVAIEGYSHEEVSELIGITESTSRSQLTRARQMLQKKYLESLTQPKNGK